MYNISSFTFTFFCSHWCMEIKCDGNKTTSRNTKKKDQDSCHVCAQRTSHFFLFPLLNLLIFRSDENVSHQCLMRYHSHLEYTLEPCILSLWMSSIKVRMREARCILMSLMNFQVQFVNANCFVYVGVRWTWQTKQVKRNQSFFVYHLSFSFVSLTSTNETILGQVCVRLYKLNSRKKHQYFRWQ